MTAPAIEVDFDALERDLHRVHHNQDFDAVLDALIEIRDLLKAIEARTRRTP